MASPPTSRRRTRGPHATPWGTATEFAFGAALLAVSALAGLAFVHRPWPNRLDVWGYRLLPSDPAARWAHDFGTLGSLTVLVVGVVAIFLVGVWRDWVRAIACGLAPVAAVLIVEDLAKPLVGRHIGITGASSYPSGTVAAVAALATAATLVMPRVLRPLTALVGTAATVGTAAAVIVMRWHFPTDTLGGIGVGVGSVLVLDALVHVPWAVAARLGPGRSSGGTRVRPEPTLA